MPAPETTPSGTSGFSLMLETKIVGCFAASQAAGPLESKLLYRLSWPRIDSAVSQPEGCTAAGGAWTDPPWTTVIGAGAEGAPDEQAAARTATAADRATRDLDVFAWIFMLRPFSLG